VGGDVLAVRERHAPDVAAVDTAVATQELGTSAARQTRATRASAGSCSPRAATAPSRLRARRVLPSSPSDVVRAMGADDAVHMRRLRLPS
jgi:hypothetical protein